MRPKYQGSHPGNIWEQLSCVGGEDIRSRAGKQNQPWPTCLAERRPVWLQLGTSRGRDQGADEEQQQAESRDVSLRWC